MCFFCLLFLKNSIIIVTMKGIQVFFFIGGVMSSLSVLLYLVVPAGTAKFFSGEDAPSVYTQFWVEVVASGVWCCTLLRSMFVELHQAYAWFEVNVLIS